MAGGVQAWLFALMRDLLQLRKFVVVKLTQEFSRAGRMQGR